MSRCTREVDRSQPFVVPVDTNEWLPKHHFSRLVTGVIDNMERDNPDIFKETHKLGGRGREPHCAKMMVGLLVVGYYLGITSSRNIVQSCHYDIRFAFHSFGRVPHFTDLARFRREHPELFDAVYGETLRISHGIGMLKEDDVKAVDSTKIKASAALSTNRSAEHIAQELAKYRAKCEETDREEDLLYGEGIEAPPPLEALLSDGDLDAIIQAGKRRASQCEDGETSGEASATGAGSRRGDRQERLES